jgi:DNA-binding HxlR family transcriptional regulator|tara:strand:+ start:173 stop:616 length:444 start_codon:yes stop_codon:yes gene_type:complete
MSVSPEDFKKLELSINDVKDSGSEIRSIFENYYDDEIDIDWEVDAAVEAFSILSSRWTIEILATLYIIGESRFNQLRTLLRGISSRTLSDKLTKCTENGLVERLVEDGPPIRVKYRLTNHGRNAGKLLSPLVAYMKIKHGRVMRNNA